MSFARDSWNARLIRSARIAIRPKEDSTSRFQVSISIHGYNLDRAINPSAIFCICGTDAAYTSYYASLEFIRLISDIVLVFPGGFPPNPFLGTDPVGDGSTRSSSGIDGLPTKRRRPLAISLHRLVRISFASPPPCGEPRTGRSFCFISENVRYDPTL